MPNKSPSQEQRFYELTEREQEMAQGNWSLTVDNYRELGEVIAEFYRKSEDNHFQGIAELVTVDGETTLKIELVADTTALYRCCDCGLVPEHPTCDNPGLCAHCMKKVCSRCAKAHERRHWRPAKTLSGNIICTKKVPCYRDGCTICGGTPF